MESKMYEIREGNCQGNANCGKIFFYPWFYCGLVGWDLIVWCTGVSKVFQEVAPKSLSRM